jgi:mannose-6-phosphate isomerase
MLEAKGKLSSPSTSEKLRYARDFEARIRTAGYSIVDQDFQRPWGGFFRLDERQAGRFIAEYFAGVELPPTTLEATLSPKFLLVEPQQLLSWQLHHRRAEVWRVVSGPVGVYTSESDRQPEEPSILHDGEVIHLPFGTRHRLAGRETRGVVAEIWIHTDPRHPSDESDIVRLADDFGRTGK